MEKLRYIALQEKSPKCELIVHVTGGGVTMAFESGDDADEVITKFRLLADALEESTKRRNW